MLLVPFQRTFLGKGERKGTPLEPWQGRTPLWRQLKGCRVLPAGVSGVSPDGPFLCSPPQAASKKRKRSFSGTPQTSAEGWLPSALPLLMTTLQTDFISQGAYKKYLFLPLFILFRYNPSRKLGLLFIERL